MQRGAFPVTGFIRMYAVTSKKLRPDLVMPITKYHNRALCKDENRQIERNRAA